MSESKELVSEHDGAERKVPRETLSRLAGAMLTNDPRQRASLLQTAFAFGLVLYGVVVGFFASRAFGMPSLLVWTWAISTMMGPTLAFVAIRLGWTKTFADRSLTTFQMGYAVTCIAIGYAMAGPMRAAAFPVLMVVMLFGCFSIPPRMVSYIAIYAVLLFGAIMVVQTRQWPDVYVAYVEVGHFLMLMVMVPVVPLLALRYANIRARVQQQQSDFIRVRDLAFRDELTGLLNRRQMTEMLKRAQTRRARSGQGYCVAVLDLDFFKRVNDTLGHAAGDDVLRQFSEIAKETVRDKDTVARWGGEEFVVLLSDTKLAAAKAGIERLRERLISTDMRVAGTVLRVTFSAGIAEPAEGESFERALSRADDALYLAKARGRDQIVTA